MHTLDILVMFPLGRRLEAIVGVLANKFIQLMHTLDMLVEPAPGRHTEGTAVVLANKIFRSIHILDMFVELPLAPFFNRKT